MNSQIVGEDTNSSTSTNPSQLEEVVGAEDNSDTQNEAVDAVLKNPLIISEILGYLDFHTLTQCRLVNKVWNEQILRKLRQRGAIRLTPPQAGWGGCLQNWTSKFAEKTKVMKALKMENISLELYGCNQLYVTKDVCWLMDNFGDQFRYLGLEMELTNGRDAAVFFNILNRLRSLKKIELDLSFEMDLKKIKLPKPLETVQSLKINNIAQFVSDYGDPSRDPSLILKLLNLFPNVEKIKLQGYFFMTTFLSNSLDDGGFLPFQHLKTLDVELRYRHGFALTFLQRLETSQQLGLENLIIRGLWLHQPELDVLMEALKRHAPTLKLLHLMMNNFGAGIDLAFKFPRLPKLKKLVIWNSPSSNEESDTALWHQVFYKNDFPLLEDLDLTITSLNCQFQQSSSMVKNLFEAFVPLGTNAHENTCVTMKRVKFSIPLDWEIDDNKIWRGKVLENFEDMFPNAILTPGTLW